LRRQPARNHISLNSLLVQCALPRFLYTVLWLAVIAHLRLNTWVGGDKYVFITANHWHWSRIFRSLWVGSEHTRDAAIDICMSTFNICMLFFIYSQINIQVGNTFWNSCKHHAHKIRETIFNALIRRNWIQGALWPEISCLNIAFFPPYYN
jgi:hypothetical protein